MAWNPDIPKPTDLLSTSQDQILQNFQALNPLFNTIGNYVLLPVQAGKPTTSSTQLSLYSFLSPNTGQIELYMGRPSTGIAIQISGASAGDYTFLASGLIMKWGNGFFNNPSGASIFDFPASASIPVFRTGTVPFVMIGGYGNVGPQADTNQYVRFISTTNLTMTVWCSQRTTTNQPAGLYTWNWVAIGLPQ